MQRVPAVTALVALAILCCLGSNGRRAAVPPDRKFDCCVCGRRDTTLVWFRPTDMVAVAMRHRLDGDGWSSPAVATVLLIIEIIKLMAILKNKTKNNIHIVTGCFGNGLCWLWWLPGM